MSNCWFVNKVYVKVNGRWAYRYWAVGKYGQAINVGLSTRRDLATARTFFTRPLPRAMPVEVTTYRAPVYTRVLDAPLPAAQRRVTGS